MIIVYVLILIENLIINFFNECVIFFIICVLLIIGWYEYVYVYL